VAIARAAHLSSDESVASALQTLDPQCQLLQRLPHLCELLHDPIAEADQLLAQQADVRCQAVDALLETVEALFETVEALLKTVEALLKTVEATYYLAVLGLAQFEPAIDAGERRARFVVHGCNLSTARGDLHGGLGARNVQTAPSWTPSPGGGWRHRHRAAHAVVGPPQPG
jgi:hypothetical protein